MNPLQKALGAVRGTAQAAEKGVVTAGRGFVKNVATAIKGDDSYYGKRTTLREGADTLRQALKGATPFSLKK